MTLEDIQRCLVIRRDNIGDLVCTTPVFEALRGRFPRTWIGALVNSYTAPVLAGNPNLDAVFTYRKAKHRNPGESALAVYWHTWRMLRTLQRMRIDLVVLASPGWQASAANLARWVRPRQVLGFAHPGSSPDLAVPAATAGMLHQVENTFRILRPLGIDVRPPAPRIYPDAALAAGWRARLQAARGPVIGVHISAREADRRWPKEHFSELIRRLLRDADSRVVMTWAPGAGDRKEFPGDDAAAASIIRAIDDKRLLAVPTDSLADLIASISVCDIMICSDGGPVHLAAAQARPVVALFGSEHPELWYPWGVPYRLLRKPSRQVRDIHVDEVLQAADALIGRAGC